MVQASRGSKLWELSQYIQARTVDLTGSIDDFTAPKPLSLIETLGTLERAIIATTDTFFITTAFQGNQSNLVQGVDVSHRGGMPRFVRVDDDQTLIFLTLQQQSFQYAW
jgi:hypothetical protein